MTGTAPSDQFSAATTDLVRAARSNALGDLLRRTAHRSPARTAVVDGDRRLTFAELDEVVDRAAAGLTADGIVAGDRVALLSHNCWQYAVLVLATARIGVVLVPLNFMLGAGEIAYILDHAGAQTLVVEDALVGLAEQALAQSQGSVSRRRWLALDAAAPTAGGWAPAEDWFGCPDDPPQVAVGDDDPVRLMYTSGTESRPKGALLSSRSLMWQYASCAIEAEMTGDDIEVHALPMYHCAQLDVFFLVDVYVGATSVILRGPDPATVLATLERERATKFFAPPTVWISLLRSPDLDSTDLSALRKGYYGASPMPVEVLKEIQSRLPDLRLWNLYGQTELSPLATFLGPDQQVSHAGSAGRPAIHVQTSVVDEADRPVPAGTVGEIVHRSPHATLGYYRDEAKTAEAFRNGWFHSGDLGYLDDDGMLYVVDRKKDMIKTGGENVASREVEEAIYLLPGVAEVAVFGVAHPRWVEAVTAVVVPKPGASLTEDEVIAHAKSQLAGYKAPKYVVIADSLPKNPSGKVLKRQLRDTHAQLGQG